jgi:hypothetical protein
MSISPAQLKEARRLLGWSQIKLAVASGGIEFVEGVPGAKLRQIT